MVVIFKVWSIKSLKWAVDVLIFNCVISARPPTFAHYHLHKMDSSDSSLNAMLADLLPAWQSNIFPTFLFKQRLKDRICFEPLVHSSISIWHMEIFWSKHLVLSLHFSVHVTYFTKVNWKLELWTKTGMKTTPGFVTFSFQVPVYSQVRVSWPLAFTQEDCLVTAHIRRMKGDYIFTLSTLAGGGVPCPRSR